MSRSLFCAALGAGVLAVSCLPAGAALPGNFGARAFTMTRGTADLGRAPATMRVHVVLGLATANRAAVDRILVRQATPGDPLYHRYLTPQQTRSIMSPAGTRVQSVAVFLARNGFTNIRVTPDNVLVSADGTGASASRAFSTELHVLASGGRRYYANVKPAVLPASLGGAVASIGGLNSFTMHPALRKKKSVESCTSAPVLNSCILSEFAPPDYATVYDVPAGTTASGTSIAIFAEGDLTQVVADLRTREQLSGLPQVPYTIVETGPQSGDTSGADEFDLDTQYSTGMAGNVAHLYIYDAPSLSDADTATEFDRFVTDGLAKAGSASFGECEVLAELAGSNTTDDAIFQEAALQGQTIFASAGDTGAFCPAPVVSQNGVPLGLPSQEYPASSTYVVSVGGTTLLANANGTYNGEIGWYSGGGGPSLVETAGSWQSGVAPIAATGVRSVPDISMDADPDTGADVIVAGASEEIGGTSLSSPLALGAWARIESAHGNALGFAAPILYKEFSDEGGTATALPSGLALTRTIGGFHDVLYGVNPLPAASGYDFSTGLGTLDIGASEADILK